MPEPLDRATFLLQVADAVDLQPAEVGEVLEELNSHLSDAAAGWREAGYDFEDAERRALRGLGDPAKLGRELGNARHRRRQVLAAVGGGVLHAFGFGLWAYLTIWVVVGGFGLVAALGTMYLARAIGWSDGSWFTGPSGSLATVVLTTAWFAWVGWALPWRVARSARRSVRGVRRAVGLTGLVLGSALLWTLPTVDMDPVLAIGLPLGPLAFFVASQRPTRGPFLFPSTTRRVRVGVAAGLILSTAIVGLVTVSPNTTRGGWESETSAFGGAAWTDPVLDTTDVSISTFGQSQAEVMVGDETQFAAFARRFTAISLEVWPAKVVDGHLIPGLKPMVVGTAPVTMDTTVTVVIPSLRTPVEVTSLLVAVAADGTRVALGGPDAPRRTPAWHGTLFEWWVTGR